MAALRCSAVGLLALVLASLPARVVGQNAQIAAYDNQPLSGGGPAGGDADDLTVNLLTLYSLEQIDQSAVCNDGSPGAKPARARCWLLLLLLQLALAARL